MNTATPSNIFCDSWSGDKQMKKKKNARSNFNCIKCQSKTTDMMAAVDLLLILTKLQALTADYN